MPTRKVIDHRRTVWNRRSLIDFSCTQHPWPSTGYAALALLKSFPGSLAQLSTGPG